MLTTAFVLQLRKSFSYPGPRLLSTLKIRAETLNSSRNSPGSQVGSGGQVGMLGRCLAAFRTRWSFLDAEGFVLRYVVWLQSG